MKLKRIICLFMMFFLLCPLYAFADDSGVLAEGELNEWVVKVLRDSAAGQPLNAPVGEESHTEDGYAFIYDFATLYYDKPVLDQDSVLLAVSVTDEAYPGPRGIKLGDAQSVLIDTYGWQNPTLATGFLPPSTASTAFPSPPTGAGRSWTAPAQSRACSAPSMCRCPTGAIPMRAWCTLWRVAW